MKKPRTPNPGLAWNSTRKLPRLIFGGMLLSALTAQAEVRLTFDTDTQGVTLGANGTSLAHSTKYGGSLAVSGNIGFNQNMAFINLRDGGPVQAELEAAIASGVGYLRYTIRVEQTDIAGGNPGWFEGICVANSRAGYDQNFGSGEGIFGTPAFPLGEPFSITITLPIKSVPLPNPIDTGAKTNTSANGQIELPANSEGEYYQLLIGLNSGGGTGYTGATFYLDDVIISAGAAPPPPAAAAYTFDGTAQGFAKFDANAPAVAYNPGLGGTVALSPPNPAGWSWRVGRGSISGDPLVKLQACMVRGGTVSFDLIGPVGTLAGRGITVTLQPHGSWSWNQTDANIAAEKVTALGDGNEIARVVLPASAFAANGVSLGSASSYNFFVGFDSAATIYLDNVLFSPNPDTGSKLTFDTSVQNFVAVGDGFVTADPGNQSLLMLNPAGWVRGGKAIFTAADADPQVAAVYAKLKTAAQRGGVLRLKVPKIAISDRAATFAGLNVIAALNGTAWQERSSWIDKSALTVGDPASETAATYSATIAFPLYPQGSTATDGFVLQQNAANYEFHLGTGTGTTDVSDVTINFDDFEVVPSPDPEIIYSPALPAGSASFVGRVLTNVQTSGTFSATGLPPGVVIDPATGLVHGTPTANGSYNVVFTVTNAGMADSTTAVVWEVTGASGGVVPPTITSFTISGTTAVISWTGTTPVTVLRSPSMAAGSWAPVSTNNATGTFTDTNAPSGKAFYRLSVP